MNSDIVNSPNRFAELVIHGLAHTFYGNREEDESLVRSREGTIYDQIFNTPGERETRPQDYYEGTTIAGSHYGDNIAAGTGNDTLSGLSGNDILNGGIGNDLVMGGAGMDWLSGGVGDNLVAGGLDADTYVPASGVGLEYIVELGGVDRIDLSAYSIHDCMFSRTGDTLNIVVPNGAYIMIENQWLAGSKIEQFVFADGIFASSYIEYLVDSVSPIFAMTRTAIRFLQSLWIACRARSRRRWHRAGVQPPFERSVRRGRKRRQGPVGLGRPG